MDSNLLSTMKALELCKENGLKKFIFISSCSVYGRAEVSKEDMECHPITINGMTKLLNESIAREFCKKHGMELIILRPFNTYGGNDQFSVVGKLLRASKGEGEFTLFNEGLATRDFVHIEDIAKVVCHFVTHSSKWDVINIGTGKAHRIIDVVKSVESKYGEVPISRKCNENEVSSSLADTSRLKQEMDIEFIDILDYIKNLP